MKNLTIYHLVIAVTVGLSTAACRGPSAVAPTDTGNMAYPAPLPQGNIATTAVSSRRPDDVGNMAFPAPLPQGDINTVTTSSRRPDTGNMAYPAPVPAGNVSRTRVR